VSFVSVTQSFNTTSSMGRLTLNVLLSFAQFEREVIGERVRDKIAASKRKGIWVGGPAPLGYRCLGKKPVIVPEEADTVRLIFTRYRELGSLGALVVSGPREAASRMVALGAIIVPCCSEAAFTPSTLSEADKALFAKLDVPNWWRDPETAAHLQDPLMRAAAWYFLRARNGRGRPVDAVARFHLGNGARLERINWTHASRGMDMVGAITFLAELGDLARFENPRQVMAYETSASAMPLNESSNSAAIFSSRTAQSFAGPIFFYKMGGGNAPFMPCISAAARPGL